MELCGPQTLSQFCRKFPNKRLPEPEAYQIFSQVLSAVRYLHRQGICHRDLKMTNLLIDESNTVKLIDFGFADYANGVLNSYCGTPAYMAPELMDRREYRGKQVDIWALGVILFKMLTGDYPFGSIPLG